jgi:hypothetical protein
VLNTPPLDANTRLFGSTGLLWALLGFVGPGGASLGYIAGSQAQDSVGPCRTLSSFANTFFLHSQLIRLPNPRPK